MSLIKFVIILFIIVGFTAIKLERVQAISVSPSSDSLLPGTSKILELKSGYTQGNVYAIRVRLSVTNLTITNFTISNENSWVVILPECTGGTLFTTTSICFTISKSAPISPNEVLGVISMGFANIGISKLTVTEGNGYSNGISFYPQTGDILNYSIAQVPIAVVVSLPVSSPVTNTTTNDDETDSSNEGDNPTTIDNGDSDTDSQTDETISYISGSPTPDIEIGKNINIDLEKPVMQVNNSLDNLTSRRQSLQILLAMAIALTSITTTALYLTIKNSKITQRSGL